MADTPVTAGVRTTAASSNTTGAQMALSLALPVIDRSQTVGTGMSGQREKRYPTWRRTVTADTESSGHDVS